MKIFQYTAEAADGHVVEGEVKAIDRADALAQLLEGRLTPLSLKPASEGLTLPRGSGTPLQGKLFERFAHRLAALNGAGVPLADALSLMARSDARLGRHAQKALDSVRRGETLAAHLSSLPRGPSPEMIALIRVGEETGTLAAQLQLVADTLSRKAAFQKELISQLIYPLALCVLIILTLFFLAHFVLPQFEEIFAAGNAAPPPETAFVLDAGRVIREWGWAFPAIILGGVVSIRLLRARYRGPLDRFTIKLPFLGALTKTAEMARFCRSLGALLIGGCTMAEALPIARAAVFNQSLLDGHEAAADGVRLGAPLSDAIAAKGLFPDEALELIRIGERTGQLGAMLVQAAQSGEERVTTTLKTLSGLLGPILTALMGAITAGVIAAVMIGVMSLNEAVY